MLLRSEVLYMLTPTKFVFTLYQLSLKEPLVNQLMGLFHRGDRPLEFSKINELHYHLTFSSD